MFSMHKHQVFSAFLMLVLSLGSLLGMPAKASALTDAEQQAQWQAELQQTEADIAKWQGILDSTKANTKSLQNDAAALNAKIQAAQATIKQKNINIQQLAKQIADKQNAIETLEERIDKGHDSLAQLLRQTNEIDQYSLPEVVLGNQDISDFFSDLDSFQSIKRDMQALFAQIRDDKTQTEAEKASLGDAQDKEMDTKAAVEDQKAQVQKDEDQKQYLIKVNQTQEKTYAQVIADQQAKAADIRAKLFKLAGGSAAIDFGTALQYAQEASAKTGVEPAFVLAILTQESNLGANVGKCYLTDTTTGAGISTTGKVWSNLMKPSRDVQPFLDITKSLGFDPMKTVVSCPIAGVAGYGGAMGPAQFIASTWQLFEDRLQSALGHFPNPWNAEDAFTASAMYLGDLGASTGTYSGEIKAACKYYGSGGTSCSYGTSVMKLKSSIQSDIDYLNEYGVSRR
jgi:peptidoglycan hydrolase CwlO-like protein